MAKTFTLELANPAITSPPTNVVDTGLTDGNKLNLILINNFGFDLEFGGSGGGAALAFVKIPKAVIDSTNATAITVAAPWTTDGIYTPDNDPDSSDNKNYYVIKLKPPAIGVVFKNGDSTTIELATLKPTAKGNATLFVSYDFGLGTTMNPSAQLAILGGTSGGKPLIGNNNALRYLLKVNDGPDTNPIVVTDQPVTSANAAENKMRLNFDFQDHNMPATQDLQTLGHLVPSWDPGNPPTFRVQFPYFNAQSQFPAPLDLTDDIKHGETNYNAYTSAWNINLSLDPDHPDVVKNKWWTIQLDPQSPSPSWLVQPTPANKYLFTGSTSGPTGSGPVLNLYFSHIYSALPLGADSQTLLYLETYDFPGFNDNLSEQSIFKEESVQITSFSGDVIYIAGAAQLQLSWKTKNAKKCFVEGDSNSQGPNTDSGPYKLDIDPSNPLQSSYTLKAEGENGVSIIRKTIDLHWQESPGPASAAFYTPTGIDISPDGTKVYLAASTSAAGPGEMFTLDGKTLVNNNVTISLPMQTGESQPPAVKNVKASPDSSKLFLAGLSFTGSTGYLFGYTTAQSPSPLAGSPVSPGFNDSANLYPIAVSDDSTQVVVSAPYANVAPFLAGYDTSTFHSTSGSPATNLTALGPIGVAIHGDNLYYPTHAGLGIMNRNTFTDLANSPVSLKSTDEVEYTPGPLAVSPDGKYVTTLAQGYLNNERAFILCQVDIATMSLVKRVQVYNGYQLGDPTPTTNLIYSADGKYLFAFGVNYTQSPPAQPMQTLLSVYDPDSLQELPGSPIALTKFIADMVIAPDSSRIYAAVLDSADATQGSVIELQPSFPNT